jgi:DHA1 family tetracycline resistance protein-like MFS transporter
MDGLAPTAAVVPTRRGGIAFILFTILLDTLGIGLIIPVAPRLVASFLNNDLARASHYFGLLVSLFSLMQFLFAPVVGGLSDRFGRRSVILVSLLGAAASYLLSGFATALSWLFVGRIIAGMTAASFSAANAYVADITPPEKRAQSFGMIGAAFGLGFILGPALGGALGDLGLRVPYFVAAGLNFLNLIYGLFVLPESLRPEARRPFSFARSNAFGAMKNLASHPIVLGLTGTLFCGFIAQWILQSVWALDLQARFGWTLRAVGISLMVIGVAVALVQGVVIRALLPRLGERRALILGIALGAAGHVAFATASRGWMIYAFIFPFALGGMAGPATQAIITREVGATEQGQLQGSVNSLGGLAAIIGPLIGTTLLGHFGPETANPHIPGAAFYAASCFNILGLVLALRVFARHRVARAA